MGRGLTKRDSPSDKFFGHWRPPKRHPDGDFAKNGDCGVSHGSPEFSIPNRDEPPYDSVMDGDIQVDNRHLCNLMFKHTTKSKSYA